MKPRLAINGFGRIGRLVLRAWLEDSKPDMDIAALNAVADAKAAKHLLQYDSVHGPMEVPLEVQDNEFVTPHGAVRLHNCRDLQEIDWRDDGIDIVLECSGKFNSRDQAALHISHGGAHKVLVSAPCKLADVTIVCGVNDSALQPSHAVISNASCTTNCLAPMAKIMDETVGIAKGYVTTIHAFTGDQRLLDGSHKDPRRARAATLSMVPTSTGAAKAVGLVLPNLAGRLDGCAMRVPTPNVSFVDLCFLAEKNTDIEQIHDAVRQAAAGEMRGVLAVCDEPLVSTDFNHHPASCIFDTSQTQIIDGNFVRVGGWYDNEWGFALRMLDTARKIAQMM